MSRPIKYLTEEDKKLAKKTARKKYVLNNKEKVNKQQKNWKEKNPDKPKSYVTKYKVKNTEKVKENRKGYYLKNKEKEVKAYVEYRKNRKLIDEIFKLKGNIRCLITNSFKKYKFKKSSKTAIIFGCSFEKFKNHLESNFEPWMNWDNHGLYNGEFDYGWDIDHIIPLSSAKTEEDVIRLNHFSNFQPLCGKFNREIKRNKITK